MKQRKVVIPAFVLLGGFVFCSTSSYGKPEYTKETQKACAYCHVDAQRAPQDLKDAGKYYQEHKTLDGYKDSK